MKSKTSFPDPPRSVQEKRFRRRLRSKQKRRIRNRIAGSGRALPVRSYQARDTIGHVRSDYFDIAVPTRLDLVQDLLGTVAFVRSFWQSVVAQKNRVRLVFEETKSIQPSALLLLLAYLHRARLIYGNDHVTGTYPRSPSLERSFQDTGFFGLLGVRARKSYSKTRKVSSKYIPFASGTKLEKGASRTLREALLDPGITMDVKARKRLFRAVSEAMLNVAQHAYPENYPSHIKVRNRWWLAGTLDRRRDELLIMFADLGIGIPKTLPKLYSWERIRSALSVLPGINPNDGDMIRAGMIIGRTQTGDTNRGKGLNDLRRFIDFTTGGELRVYSGAGAYTYQSNGMDSVLNSSESIGGTLIKWTAPLSQVTNWKPEDFEYDDDDEDD